MDALKYFRVTLDMQISQRAYATFPLSAAEYFPELTLMGGEAWERGPVQLEASGGGRFPDWNYLTNTTIPLVSSRVAECICRIAGLDVVRVPASITGRGDAWEILAVPVIDCADGDRADLLAAVRPTIVLERSRGAHLFRLPSLSLIASEPLRAALLAEGISGVEFTAVATR
jgi:hypothetical protein